MAAIVIPVLLRGPSTSPSPGTPVLLAALGAALLAILACGCGTHVASHVAPSTHPAPIANTDHFVECHNGVVVSVSGPATDVGLAILKQGGNAVDAAVATAFAMDVAYPIAGNLGGGGFMLIHPAPRKGPPVAIDYRECAPAAAWATMFNRTESQFTCKDVAVPGTIRGMEMAHRRFGSLPWRQLLQPSVALARNGYVVDANLAGSLNDTLPLCRDFTEFQRVFGKPGGGLWRAGDIMVQADLARTLQRLADLGPDAFYNGPFTKGIVAEMRRGNGLITAADMASYHAIARKPLTTRYRGKYDVYVPPPPSSGGVCLLEELNILQAFDLRAWGRWSPELMHVMAEAMRRANYDRARYLGDPAFVHIPSKLISPAYGEQLAKTIDLHKATRSADLSRDIFLAPESKDTTHFSIIDRDGMAVANTYTLERRWGSRIVVRNMGFLLNNEMRAFNMFPGVTTAGGDIGTAPNTIAPGKRPLSSMTPTIVAKNGRVKLITGSPGSQAIPHTVLNIMVSVFDFGMPIQAAVDSPRFSNQWLPDRITFEAPERYPETMKVLKEMGHIIVRTGPLPQGDAHTIWVEKPNTYIGVADRRYSGKVAGY
ncbi:MAG TPA: gamma-glutamyltransferase [Tepidisphaeraceae bacterium]|nr:gamma-glutamyltransferase [Tepidisphaeraceae bacterium]